MKVALALLLLMPFASAAYFEPMDMDLPGSFHTSQTYAYAHNGDTYIAVEEGTSQNTEIWKFDGDFQLVETMDTVFYSPKLTNIDGSLFLTGVVVDGGTSVVIAEVGGDTIATWQSSQNGMVPIRKTTCGTVECYEVVARDGSTPSVMTFLLDGTPFNSLPVSISGNYGVDPLLFRFYGVAPSEPGNTQVKDVSSLGGTTTVTTMPFMWSNPYVAAVGGARFLSGGINMDGPTPTATAWKYDGAWHEFPNRIYSSFPFAHEGRAWFIGEVFDTSGGHFGLYRLDEANQVPQASISGPARSEPEEVKAFQATAADNDDTEHTFFWDFGDGFTVTGPDAVHSYQEEGTYTISVTATDDEGASHTATLEHTVANPPRPPPYQPPPPSPPPSQPQPNRNPTVTMTAEMEYLVGTFTATTSDPDGDLVSVSWDFGDGATAMGHTVTHTFELGSYIVKATASDGKLEDSAVDIVTASYPDPPDFTITGPKQGIVGDSLRWTATEPVEWTLAGQTGSGATFSWKAEFGTYQLKATSTDEYGQTTSRQMQIRIAEPEVVETTQTKPEAEESPVPLVPIILALAILSRKR